MASILRTMVTAGLFAIVVLSPTQLSIEVFDKTYLSPADPLVWLTFAVWALYLVVSKDFGSVKAVPLFHVLFLLAVVLSAVRASHRLAALKEIFQVAEYFIVVTLLFLSHLRDPRLLRRAVYAFLGVGTVLIAWGWGHYLSPSVDSFHVRSAFGNRSVFGGYLSLALPLAYGMMLLDTSRWRRVWLVLAVLAGLAVILAGGTLVAVTVALVVMSAWRGPRVLLACVAVLLLLGLLVGRLPRGNLGTARESTALYNDKNEVNRRYLEWEAALTMMAENPWLGVGAGNYQRNIGQYYGILPVPARQAEADSQMLYLVLGSSLGVPGLACFLGMLAMAAVGAMRQYFLSDDRFRQGLALGIAGSVIAFSINAIWSPLLVRGIGVPLSIVLALASLLNSPQSNDHAGGRQPRRQEG